MSMDFGYVECALHAAMRFAIYSIVHAPMRASTAGGLSTACLESTLGPCVQTRRGPERRSAPVHTHTWFARDFERGRARGGVDKTCDTAAKPREREISTQPAPPTALKAQPSPQALRSRSSHPSLSVPHPSVP